MKKFLFVILIILSSAECFTQKKNQVIVTASKLKEWVSYLASDEMRGRANGSDEMKTAGSVILLQMK